MVYLKKPYNLKFSKVVIFKFYLLHALSQTCCILECFVTKKHSLYLTTIIEHRLTNIQDTGAQIHIHTL